MSGGPESNDAKDFSPINPKSSDPIPCFSLTTPFSNFNRLEEDGRSDKKGVVKPRKVRFTLCCSSSCCISTNPIKIRKKSWKRVKEMDEIDKICGDIEELAELESAVDDSSSVCSSSEEACKEFRKHLIEMVVDEKDVRDLKDVEELLCCYRNLRSPVYKGLIREFYVNLCMDIFCSNTVHDISSESLSMTSV